MSEHNNGAGHGSFKSYMIGFLLSVVLTLIPFGIVMGNVFESALPVIFIVFTLGALQMLVHLHYFMHVSLKVEEGWQAMSLIFTVLLVVIILAGSIWIMFHLDANMMPGHEQMERLRQMQ